jgi:Protein of unknown function (DUF3311)
MKTAVSAVTLLVLFLLHQDFWFWRQARPLVFGALPIGLFYHATYTLATSLVLVVLVRLLWPSDLDPEGSRPE